MRKSSIVMGTLALGAIGSGGTAGAKPDRPLAESARTAPAHPATAAPGARRLYLDVHDLGPGKVTAQAVAGAHQKDLAAQAKHGVTFKAYWLDEKQGRIYCLAEAPSGDAVNQVHQDAHGLLASNVVEVVGDNTSWTPAPGKRLYLDRHHLGAGKVTAQAVAAAHARDLAVQAKHDVKYLNYWFDAGSGTVMCLTEAASADAALAVHKEAHGLMPDVIEEVVEGR